MAKQHHNMSDLIEENRILRQAIDAAKLRIKAAAECLSNVQAEEFFLEAASMEVSTAIEIASVNIVAALCSLNIPTSNRHTSNSGGPTRQQGQFLAFIREYMLRNHRGVAPGHADFQRFFNLTPPSVNSMLKRLDEKGYIRRIPGQARAIELKIAPEFIPALERPFRQ